MSKQTITTKVVFSTDEGKFKDKAAGELILDDEAWDTLASQLLDKFGVNPNAVELKILNQHLEYIDKYNREHWRVTASATFQIQSEKCVGLNLESQG